MSSSHLIPSDGAAARGVPKCAAAPGYVQAVFNLHVSGPHLVGLPPVAVEGHVLDEAHVHRVARSGIIHNSPVISPPNKNTQYGDHFTNQPYLIPDLTGSARVSSTKSSSSSSLTPRITTTLTFTGSYPAPTRIFPTSNEKLAKRKGGHCAKGLL
eukprot:CAMPEP_0197586480 /NCGR_PEP_ID=MMETSP1326-20131121/8443_1 /TAXON_ID=1155430 /ORGANISM="Genus nov. species nov., Strain RCC2288" /LENGTH=154 /DNA_ID=CAMNT_0043151115 /DNA_START=210 /DNA_END=675 /DNA_ORIENTATION=-